MATKTCPHCGEEHLDIALGQHMKICERENPDKKFDLRALEQRITFLEKLCSNDMRHLVISWRGIRAALARKDKKKEKPDGILS